LPSAAPHFAALVMAGDASRVLQLIPPGQQTAALHAARQGYAAGFSAAMLLAATIAFAATALVAFLMRPIETTEAAQAEGRLKPSR
jgi:hypothetical protein